MRRSTEMTFHKQGENSNNLKKKFAVKHWERKQLSNAKNFLV